MEVKSGKIADDEFTRQIGIDETMIKEEGWQITYNLQQAPTPEQMEKLVELEAKYPGRFNLEVGTL